MRLRIFLGAIIGIVCRDQFDIVLFSELQKDLVNAVFIFLTVAHDFQIEVLTELLLPPEQSFLGLVFPYVQDFSGHLAVEVSGQYYDCLLYTSPSPRDGLLSRMPSSA